MSLTSHNIDFFFFYQLLLQSTSSVPFSSMHMATEMKLLFSENENIIHLKEIIMFVCNENIISSNFISNTCQFLSASSYPIILIP